MSKVTALGQRLSRLLVRKELVSIFIMVFAADVVTGIFSPTFSLYATSLGASLTLVGALSSVAGLSRILSSVPVGMISDRKGRKGVLAAGMFLLSASALLYTFVQNPYLLVPVRMLQGVSITSIFFIGMAYVGDNVARSDLGLVSGVYTTCMGLGFTLGSQLGGKMAADFGYNTTYRVAAAVALFGFFVAVWGLVPKRHVAQIRTLPPTLRLSMLTKQPRLLAASMGYMLTILMFDAAIVTFFPLYAKSLFISQATIGTMLAIRALASTSVRMPTGMLTTRFPSQRLMLVALILGNVMILALSLLSTPVPLTFMLVGEGMCFGIYLTAGQAFINESYGESERGMAIGVYSMTGSIASLAGPFLLGAVADHWGLRAVFVFTAGLVFLGILAFIYLTGRGSYSKPDLALPGSGVPSGTSG